MPYRILLVEDDSTLRETIACNLRAQGYEVLLADVEALWARKRPSRREGVGTAGGGHPVVHRG
jgi:hypothetical protein